MALYHEASLILEELEDSSSSLKSRVYNKSLKSPASQLYALVIETIKWSPELSEVIERSELLTQEKKVCIYMLFFLSLLLP